MAHSAVTWTAQQTNTSVTITASGYLDLSQYRIHRTRNNNPRGEWSATSDRVGTSIVDASSAAVSATSTNDPFVSQTITTTNYGGSAFEIKAGNTKSVIFEPDSIVQGILTPTTFMIFENKTLDELFSSNLDLGPVELFQVGNDPFNKVFITIPEPSTFTLLGLAAFGVMFIRR